MNLVLTGYRGTGKTTVAKKVSEALRMPLVQTDKIIEQKAQAAIPQIVRDLGWDEFRKMEREAVSEAAKRSNSVIDLGGGAIVDEENRKALMQDAVVLLTASASAIKKRIEASNRPALTQNGAASEIKTVLKEREPIYRKAASTTFDTTAESPEKTAEKIISYWNNVK